MSIEDKILQIFQNNNKPMRPGEVAEKAGLDKKDVDKAIKKLRAEGKIVSPKRCYYSLAE